MLLGVFLTFGVAALGQNNYSVKGTIADTVEKVKLVTSAGFHITIQRFDIGDVRIRQN